MADKRITDLGERSTFDETCQVPLDDGTQTFKTTGDKMFDFFTGLPFLGSTRNVGLSASASAGALTINLKQIDGSTALDTEPNNRISGWFRSNTITSGARSKVIFNAPISLVIPSGATLGYQNGNDAKIYVYLYYDGTNKGVAVSSKLQNEKSLFSLVAIDTASDADSIYTDAARTSAALLLIGTIQIDAITTAGTWTTPSSIYITEKAKANLPYRMEVFTTSGANTYYKKPNVAFIKVTVVGGGGGGGSTQTTGAGEVANGGCGGGAGASIKIIQNSALAATETVTVGAFGTGGTAGSDNAGTGGTSSFGSHCSATGGQGGSRGTATNSSASASGGDVGEGSGGDINICGTAGQLGRVQSGSASLSNISGSSILGGGIRVGATASGSQPPSGYGNGGSAATQGASTSSRAGGNGRDGIVIVEEWYL